MQPPPLLLALAGLLLAPAAADGQACELHIWPSDGLKSVRQRGFESSPRGGAIPALILEAQRKGAEKADARAADTLAASGTPEPLDLKRQAAILSELKWSEMLGLPGYRPVFHETPLDSATIRTVKTRYIDSAAPCYADLVVDDVVYSREYARGQNLKTLFRFRDFGDAATPTRSFGTWVQTKLTIFSLDPLNVSAPALDELASALRSNATAFSELLARRQQPTATTK
ncbi:hypothetical protein [Sphingomonas koreensis]